MNGSKKVAFHTLGCKLNLAETSSISRNVAKAGYEIVDFNVEADAYVINTCSVTENADKECRFLIRGILNKSPEALIAVIGCYAQLKPDEISALPGVDLVLGANEKFNLPFHLERIAKKGKAQVHSCSVSEIDFFSEAYTLDNRTRAFLKVQDGCDYTCSYCTIPLARGASRSDSISNVVANAKKIAAKGVKEIVLTGVNIGDFGRTLLPVGSVKNEGESVKNERFLDLIKQLDAIQEIYRFRISSIEPNLLKDEIIEFVASSRRFVPHFHLPLQSGSDSILKKMRRRYTSASFSNRVHKIKQLIPDCCIGVDVITGFPGETEADFLETYHFLNALDISYLHVFTYSERKNTDAPDLGNPVRINERRNRNKMLRILSEKKLRKFYEENMDSSHTVLFEQESKGGCMYGYTENYIKIKSDFDSSLVNQLVPVTLSGFQENGALLFNFNHTHVSEPLLRV